MASILYVFPHPDDESFGPAPLLARQRQQGHDVHLLTLTRGEATSQRERLGLSKDEMAETRYEEMMDVAGVLDLASIRVLQYPDGGLPEQNPLMLEDTVAEHLHRTEADVVVTYPVHGVSGHPDHLVTHAIVKRVVCAFVREGIDYPRRLAFFTLAAPSDDTDRPPHLQHSPDGLIDCVIPLSDDDVATGKEALHCYTTYRPVIEEHTPIDSLGGRIHLEFFGETFDPVATDVCADLARADTPWLTIP
jgi:LmbE family N-acetylglucosaminyl deacetylase